MKKKKIYKSLLTHAFPYCLRKQSAQLYSVENYDGQTLTTLNFPRSLNSNDAEILSHENKASTDVIFLYSSPAFVFENRFTIENYLNKLSHLYSFCDRRGVAYSLSITTENSILRDGSQRNCCQNFEIKSITLKKIEELTAINSLNAEWIELYDRTKHPQDCQKYMYDYIKKLQILMGLEVTGV